ncbi:hypothetical protein NODU109028_21200 [Nocardioides dubius]
MHAVHIGEGPRFAGDLFDIDPGGGSTCGDCDDDDWTPPGTSVEEVRECRSCSLVVDGLDAGHDVTVGRKPDTNRQIERPGLGGCLGLQVWALGRSMSASGLRPHSVVRHPMFRSWLGRRTPRYATGGREVWADRHALRPGTACAHPGRGRVSRRPRFELRVSEIWDDYRLLPPSKLPGTRRSIASRRSWWVICPPPLHSVTPARVCLVWGSAVQSPAVSVTVTFCKHTGHLRVRVGAGFFVSSPRLPVLEPLYLHLMHLPSSSSKESTDFCVLQIGQTFVRTEAVNLTLAFGRLP